MQKVGLQSWIVIWSLRPQIGVRAHKDSLVSVQWPLGHAMPRSNTADHTHLLSYNILTESDN